MKTPGSVLPVILKTPSLICNLCCGSSVPIPTFLSLFNIKNLSAEASSSSESDNPKFNPSSVNWIVKLLLSSSLALKFGPFLFPSPRANLIPVFWPALPTTVKNEKTQDKYNSKLALISFYNIKGNMPMAFRVIDDGLASNELNGVQKENLKSIRIAILCDGNPPLEPIFGNKTCD